MVSTHLKNISQNGNLPQIGVKIITIWNHHLDHDRQLEICSANKARPWGKLKKFGQSIHEQILRAPHSKKFPGTWCLKFKDLSPTLMVSAPPFLPRRICDNCRCMTSVEKELTGSPAAFWSWSTRISVQPKQWTVFKPTSVNSRNLDSFIFVYFWTLNAHHGKHVLQSQLGQGQPLSVPLLLKQNGTYGSDEKH